MYGEAECIQDFGGKVRRKEDLDKEQDWGGIGWIELAQDKDQWKAFVNTVMNYKYCTRLYYCV
jgi:hypothetical protein